MQQFDEILEKSDVTEVISRKEFLQKLETAGINLTDIDEETRLPKDIMQVMSQKRACNEQFYIFNMAIKQMHLSGEINIVDSAIYMFKEFFDMRIVIKCLSEENVYLIRQELLKRYPGKNKTNSSLKLYFS